MMRKKLQGFIMVWRQVVINCYQVRFPDIIFSNIFIIALHISNMLNRIMSRLKKFQILVILHCHLMYTPYSSILILAIRKFIW